MMATGTTAKPASAPAAAPAPAPAPAAADAGGTGVPADVRVGNSVEVYSEVMEKWVPAVVLSKSGSKITVSYSTEQELNCRSTSLRSMGSGQKEVTAASSRDLGGSENAHKIGASGPQSVIDALPPLEKGIRYHQVRKQGGMGRRGANEYMFISAGRMGIHLYHMTDGSHFKTYAYEDLKSWEAGQTVLLLEKRKDKGGPMGPNVKTVEYLLRAILV